MFESIIVLPEDKHEVFFPVALKCLGYFLFRSLALDVSQVRKSLGVTFTCKNGLDDTYAGFPVMSDRTSVSFMFICCMAFCIRRTMLEASRERVSR